MKQSDIVKKIRKLGYKVTVLNAHPSNRGGIPDVVVSMHGEPIFLEIKIDKDRLSKLQLHFSDEFFKSCFTLHYESFENSYYIKCHQAVAEYPNLQYYFVLGLRDKLNLNAL